MPRSNDTAAEAVEPEPTPDEAVQQRVPFEANEDGSFTPPCFLKLKDEGKFDNPPVFHLRWCTPRDKRERGLMMEEMGAVSHDTEELREELLRGLRLQWGEEKYAEHLPIIEAYWQAADDWDLQRKDDPSLEFEYDPVVKAAMRDLELDVTEFHRPLGKMLRRNSRASQMAVTTMLAVAVKGFTGLGFEPKIDRSYLDIDQVDEVNAALQRLDEDHGLERGRSSAELFIACSNRFRLREEEAKNSASPSPSEISPQPSTNGAEQATADGKSPEQDSSTKTPAEG